MLATECECEESGWCHRHRCIKSEFDFQMCRRRRDYFSAWQEGHLEVVGSADVSGRVLPCEHRGGVVGQEICAGCKGMVRLKLFACDLRGECTQVKQLAGVACCVTCEDYDAAPISTKQ